MVGIRGEFQEPAFELSKGREIYFELAGSASSPSSSHQGPTEINQRLLGASSWMN